MTSTTPKLLEIKPVVVCTVLRRINRFVVEVEMGDRVSRVYLCNTGRLAGYLVKGREGFCAENSRPRKLRYRLFSIRDDGLGAILDTQLQLKSFERAINLIPPFRDCKISRRNVRVGESVLDYLLKCPGGDLVLEVKSAVLRIDGYASYPDCPSTRARKQLRDLIRASDAGHRGAILFIAALPNVSAFKPNIGADQELYRMLLEARDRGVEIGAISIAYNPEDLFIYLLDPWLRVEL
ncbi:MAG: DNA/RNA nuclease SfsA [Nitrososphaerota archaeon]|nr:DNA/RNA nuclease SfsA [Nitrososphaerota archaeon]